MTTTFPHFCSVHVYLPRVSGLVNSSEIFLTLGCPMVLPPNMPIRLHHQGSSLERSRVLFVETPDLLPAQVSTLGLPLHRPVLVLVGGAGNLEDEGALEGLFTALAQVAENVGAIVVDGGTDAGVMRLMGRARAATRGAFPLVGVAPRGRVRLPHEPAAADDHRVLVEPHHTHLILVPGDAWGDESPYLAQVATLLAGDAPSVTVLVNGGEVARQDVAHSLAEGRPVVVIAGTGRLADEMATAADHPAGVHVVGLDEAADVVRSYLTGKHTAQGLVER